MIKRPRYNFAEKPVRYTVRPTYQDGQNKIDWLAIGLCFLATALALLPAFVMCLVEAVPQ